MLNRKRFDGVWRDKMAGESWGRTMGKDARKDGCMSEVHSAGHRWVSRGTEPSRYENISKWHGLAQLCMGKVGR